MLEEIKLIQNNQEKHNTHMPNLTSILPKNPFKNKADFLTFENQIQNSEENFTNLVRNKKFYSYKKLPLQRTCIVKIPVNFDHANFNSVLVFKETASIY